MTLQTRDIIDFLAGIDLGSHLDVLRAKRPETRLNAQKSFDALFAPEHLGDVTLEERFAVATFVAGLHKADEAGSFYASGLREQANGASLVAAVGAEAARADTAGPYGRYPAGPLSREDRPGLVYEVSHENRAHLGPKLSAALEHSHLLVFRPREASAEALQKLLDAGWTITGIVTLSQLVAFLAFQIRVVAGLRALAANSANVAQAAQA
ncbi:MULTISPECIES: CMD domain protein [unclassified Rhizobium]|jgi:CMD domain protein|uniref:CMD domain protein n=1 Tax=unclassified Rhizobium TaxID=2613769 RepID=UPI00064845A6|nr:MULTISPECIES: CMD domain protein [unclassified Rhizobium]OJY63809.1 MAG: CMD domain protein [Rhizobium sp. 60-20]RKD60802.1 CMD domain protein [Rhizobium sp. WW_1]